MSINTTTYSLLPVTRIATTPRAHADITIGFSKHGDLSIIFSPAFLAEHEAFGVGSKVLLAYSAEAKKLLIAPPSAARRTFSSSSSISSFVWARMSSLSNAVSGMMFVAAALA